MAVHPAIISGALLLVAACAGDRPPAPTPPAPAAATPPPPAPAEADWASKVGQLPDSARQAVQPPTRPASLSDAGEDDEALVGVRRLVYRASFIVPPAFRDRRAGLIAPAGELHVDVSLHRLRARFVGPGWPVDDGSEVRLRDDVPGSYVFDGQGGRPLGPGELASWFEGRDDGGRSRSSVRIRRDPGKSSEGPATMMCSLLEEWTRQQRDSLVHRCSAGALPPGFRFGPWSAELTALVPMELPRSALRADEIDPPPPPEHRALHSLLTASELARLRPARGSALEGPPATLQLRNNTATRVILLAQGLPIGWLDAHHSGSLTGFVPGLYRVGALRPFGVLRMAPTSVRLPGSLRVGKKPAE